MNMGFTPDRIQILGDSVVGIDSAGCILEQMSLLDGSSI